MTDREPRPSAEVHAGRPVTNAEIQAVRNAWLAARDRDDDPAYAARLFALYQQLVSIQTGGQPHGARGGRRARS